MSNETKISIDTTQGDEFCSCGAKISERYGITNLSVRIVVLDNGRMYKRLSRRNDTTRHEWNQYYVYRVERGFVFLNDNVHKSRIAQIDEAIK